MDAQDVAVAEWIFCDSSENDHTRQLVETRGSPAHHIRATVAGAAPQRNEGVGLAKQPFILFMDDDITLEPGCLRHLWQVMHSFRPLAAGVTATIINEAYVPPGKWTRKVLQWLDEGRERSSYAGACVGPGWTFWPEDNPQAANETATVEWLGTGCVLYRRDAMPTPPFPSRFTGASLCEDLALSLIAAKNGPLLQSRRARFFHWNAGGDHKKNSIEMGDMAFTNRYHVLTQIMGKREPRDLARLLVMLFFGLAGNLRHPQKWPAAALTTVGYLRGILRLAVSK